MRTQEWKEEQIKILKEIQAEKPNATFWAEGYCPQEGEPDEDTNDNGQYWTDWDGLTAEELLDKLEDDRYDIEDWDEEEQLEQEFNKNLDKLANDDVWMNCTYKTMDKNGNYVQCSNKVLKKNIDKNNQNNNYCSWHQEFVYEINKKRIAEANQKLIKNINKWIKKNQWQNKKIIFDDYGEYSHELDLSNVIDSDEFLEKLNNGDFDE